MELLDTLKAKLKITWHHEDDSLADSILSGKEYLKGLTGTTLDFETKGEARTMLLEYCRYDYNNAIEYFEENFANRLTRLQYTEEIKEYRAANMEVGT